MSLFKFYCPSSYSPFYGSNSDFERVKQPDEADFYLIPGGTDISPFIYGQDFTGAEGVNYARDAQEIAAIGEARAYGIPVVGICRGAQLIHALNGGTLIQHIEGHRSSTHKMMDADRKKVVAMVNSLHHQAIPSNEAIKMYGKRNVFVSEDGLITEAFFDEGRQTYGVQYHPEFSSCPKEAYNFFRDKLYQYLT